MTPPTREEGALYLSQPELGIIRISAWKRKDAILEDENPLEFLRQRVADFDTSNTTFRDMAPEDLEVVLYAIAVKPADKLIGCMLPKARDRVVCKYLEDGYLPAVKRVHDGFDFVEFPILLDGVVKAQEASIEYEGRYQTRRSGSTDETTDGEEDDEADVPDGELA